MESTVEGISFQLKRASTFPDWLKPRRGSPRMFENPLFEKFSRVHPATPIVLYSPLALFMLWMALKKTPAHIIPFLFVGGVLTWTFLEYLIHRFAFHFEPRSAIGRKIHFIVHGVHHMYPWDYSRLVMPPAVSITLAVIFWLITRTLLGDFAFGFFAGMTVGYIAYDMIHFCVHRYKAPQNKVLRKLWEHHLKHHFSNPNKRFGVSSPLWDVVFRTLK